MPDEEQPTQKSEPKEKLRGENLEFSKKATLTLKIAAQEAANMGNEYVATHHLLLALMSKKVRRYTVAGQALKNLGVSLRHLRLTVETLTKSSGWTIISTDLPYSPRLNEALDYAADEAYRMKSQYVSTPYLLLGLLRVPDTVASRSLQKMHVDLGELREVTRTLFGLEPQKTP